MQILLLFGFISFVRNLVWATADTDPESHIVLESRDLDAHPREWQRRSAAHKVQILPMKIGLTQRNLEHAESFIMDVSSPSSKNFGRHWTVEEVANAFAPSAETNNRVLRWLEESGIHKSRVSHSAGRNWIQFNASILEVENLLHTEYHVFEHEPSGNIQTACDYYHVPRLLKDHIDFIMPTIQLDGLESLRKRHMPTKEMSERKYNLATVEDSPKYYHGLTGVKHCYSLITIDCLRAIYKFPILRKAQKGNKMGIAEWGDYLYRPDLCIFFQNFTQPKIPSNVFPDFISIDGGRRATQKDVKRANVIESALDFQTSYSIIYPQQLRLYQVGDSINTNLNVGLFNRFLDALDASYCTHKEIHGEKYISQNADPKAGGHKGPLKCGGAPISNVISISYNQVEARLPRRYQYRQCHEYMKLGLLGVSVLFASGDSGVESYNGATHLNECLDAHSNKESVNGSRFNPGFPENCPYVTVVGATDLLTPNIHGGERAIESFFKHDPSIATLSGGGFSNYFTLPSYQRQAVERYQRKYLAHRKDLKGNVYNDSGNARAFPDVSSLGYNLITVFDNATFLATGTSGSTPTVASIVTLLNEKRIEAGKGPIGFLNPIFYANPDAFNDVTVGGNPGCGTQGFRAEPGWDPVTGLGTPNYPKLEKVFMSLP